MTFGGGPLFLQPSSQSVLLPFLDREFPIWRELHSHQRVSGQG
jgi:hypothetical protein